MRRSMPIEVCALAALLAATPPVQAEDKTSLIEIDPRGQALVGAVNASGSVVVGAFNSGGGFYWMPTTGSIFLGGQQALGVSGDGTRIVGIAYDPTGVENAAFWLRGTEWQLLGSFANAVPCDKDLSSATATSRDGSVIVGIAFNGCGPAHAFRWEEKAGMVDLGSLVSGRSTQAMGVSGDGRVVVGGQDEVSGYRRGARWASGREELFTGPAGGVVGSTRAVNHDGSIVAGRQCRPDLASDQSAWIWTPNGGTECLPAPGRMSSQLVVITEANAMSDDGRVIGGRQGAAGSTDQDAVIWIDRSPAYLKDFLRANGVPDAFATWINTGEITGVSPDGRILVGYGAPLGGYRGYMVILGSKLVMP
jgi:probable HAF family extracellular repeat protein